MDPVPKTAIHEYSDRSLKVLGKGKLSPEKIFILILKVILFLP
jgi:hypothetical protein